MSGRPALLNSWLWFEISNRFSLDLDRPFIKDHIEIRASLISFSANLNLNICQVLATSSFDEAIIIWT